MSRHYKSVRQTDRNIMGRNKYHDDPPPKKQKTKPTPTLQSFNDHCCEHGHTHVCLSSNILLARFNCTSSIYKFLDVLIISVNADV
jgi:hypothetical protein